jgi:hypothetical protein
MAFEDLADLIKDFTVTTLTETVRNIKTQEPLLLTQRLGRNRINSNTPTCVFDVETTTYQLAEMGYDGDPATQVRLMHSVEEKTITPPQIYLEDQITAREIMNIRTAGMNPINISTADQSTVYEKFLADKQSGLTRLIDRRLEWMYAQGLRGILNYQPPTGRRVVVDYGFTALNEFTCPATWDVDTADPIEQLAGMAKYFKTLNNQISPDFIVMGGNAGDAFQKNKTVKDWQKSPGQQLYFDRTPLGKGETQSLGVIKGAEIQEYSSTYQDSGLNAVSYIDPDTVYMTYTAHWRTLFGAIADFDAGDPPIIVGERASKLIRDPSGKKISLIVESHPLVYPVSTVCVVRMKVLP